MATPVFVSFFGVGIGVGACLLLTTASSATEPRLASEFGYQSALTTQKSDFSRSLFYLQPSYGGSLETNGSGVVDFNASLRGSIDELSIRALWASLSQDHWKITGGFQEIPWGETFGFPILDLVNPRDYRDPLIQDPSWVRLPVAAIQSQIFLDRLTLQGVFVPIPRETSKLGTSSEYGGKASYLFENGVDLGLIYYHHWNRNPSYQLEGQAPPFQLVPTSARVDTLGTTLSYSFDQVVIREDSAIHLNQPLQAGNLGQITYATQWQNILGSDLTFENDWVVGLQFQTEVASWSTDSRFLKWMSARASKRFWNGRFEPEIYFFSGMGNPDRWLAPKINLTFADSWMVSIRADLVYYSGNPSDGYLWTVRDQSRLLFWATWKI